ncbi:MAG: TolB family protein, partial [Gemmatimonadota bacterium]
MIARVTGALAAGVLLLGTPTAVWAQTRALELEDYYGFRGVGSPAMSPDGSQVAYVVTELLEDENRRHSELWLASTDGSAPPIRLTSPSFDASGPRWSADGSLLSFSSRRPAADGSRTESTWLLRMDRPAGEAFQLEGLGGGPIFSPDAGWIAFTRPTPPPPAPPPAYASEFERKTVERFDGRVYDWMNYRFDRRGYLADPRDPQASPPRELYVLDAAGGQPRQLTHLGVDVQGPAWSADGGLLAFT